MSQVNIGVGNLSLAVARISLGYHTTLLGVCRQPDDMVDVVDELMTAKSGVCTRISLCAIL